MTNVNERSYAIEKAHGVDRMRGFIYGVAASTAVWVVLFGGAFLVMN